MAHRRRDRRGRPRKANAKRRATTLAARRAPDDLGSPELLARKAKVANGAAAPVELIDVVGVLAAHGLLEPELTLIARLLAAWLRQVQRAFHLSQASPTALWAALTSGQRAGQWVPLSNTPGCDRALLRLAELYEHFGQLGQLPQLALVMRVVEGSPGRRRYTPSRSCRLGCGLSWNCNVGVGAGRWSRTRRRRSLRDNWSVSKICPWGQT
jgi:hypothetical protein